MIQVSKILASLPKIKIELAARFSLEQALIEICKLTAKFLECEVVNIYSLDHLNEELILSATSSKKKISLISNKNYSMKVGQGSIGNCAQLNRIINYNIREVSCKKINEKNESKKDGGNQDVLKKTSENEKLENNFVLVPIRNINGTVDGKVILNNFLGVLEAKNKILKIDGLPYFSTTDEGILELISLVTHSFMHPKGKKAKNMILISNLRNILSISNHLFLYDEISEILHFSEVQLLKLLNAENVRIFLKTNYSFKNSIYAYQKFIDSPRMFVEKRIETKGVYYNQDKQKIIFNLNDGIIGKVIKSGQMTYIKDVYNEPDYNGK